LVKLNVFMGLAVSVAVVGATSPAAAQNPPPVASYVFKPKDIRFKAPMKPVTHIADIVAQHRGKSDWAHTVVKDPWFFIQYIQMASGKKTAWKMQSDTIAWFIVNSGQVRFNFKNHPPIVAGVDAMVSIPARTAYSIETVGDAPSIRFEVQNANAGMVYPVADNPTPPVAPPGFETVQVNCTCNTNSLAGAKPAFLDYGAWLKANPTSTARPPMPNGDNFFVRDPNGFTVPIRSAGVDMPPAGVNGHFHLALAEWWYALEGDMATRIEGVGDVFAKHGDIIYSPHGAYHRTVMTGKPFSTRAASGKTGVNDAGASFQPADRD
jgi:mannose-6-phosphate isomerase-like protein (cupin superfamily)